MNILLICAPSARKLRKRIKVREFLKTTISVILSAIIIFGCCFYTYADRELPGRTKQITVTSEYNDNVTIKKLAKQYRDAVKYYYEREEARNGPRAINYNPQEKEKLDKDTVALLRCVQADINKIKFQAESEINEATSGIQKISERLNS